MTDANILRKESKRWITSKTSYDGDDWGNEYESEELTPTDTQGTPLEIPETPLVKMKDQNLNSISEEDGSVEPVNEVQSETFTSNVASQNLNPQPQPQPQPEQPALTPNTNNTTPQSKKVPGQHESRSNHVKQLSQDHTDHESEIENEGGTSIQDIYEFYEEGYNQHPYSAFLSSVEPVASNEFSDSTASLSTGNFSTDTSLHPDHQSGARKSSMPRKTPESNLGKVEEKSSDMNATDEIDSIVDAPYAESHPVVTSKNDISRDDISNTDTLEETIAKPGVSDDGPNKISHIENESAPANQAFDSQSQMASEDLHQPMNAHSKLEHLESEIAELYQGSSEFLNRPISTYQGNQLPTSISDNSIKELLTPVTEQKEFDSPPPEIQPSYPEIKINNEPADPVEVKITEHSPEQLIEENKSPAISESGLSEMNDEVYSPASRISEDADVDADLSNHSEPNTKTPVDTTKNNLSKGLNIYNQTEDDSKSLVSERSSSEVPGNLGYVDYEIHQSDSSVETNSDASSIGEKMDTAFTLPSEKNKIHYKATEGFNTDPHDTKSINSSTAHSMLSSSSIHSNSSRGAHSVASSRVTTESDILDDEHNTTSMSQSSRLSDSNSSKMRTLSLDGESSIKNKKSSLNESVNDDLETTTKSAGTSSGQAPNPKMPSTRAAGNQSIAAKVKRLPQLDFTALMNPKNMDSESRTEQLRLLRIRENEYSTSLDAWLATTLTHVDSNMIIYKNGMPPEAVGLELDTAAKVSSVVHSSASNTRDKLVQVGEKSKSLGTKSKSFFAKVIR